MSIPFLSAPVKLMPETFVKIEYGQLHSETDQRENEATVKVAKPKVGQPKANQVAYRFKGQAFDKCSSGKGRVRFHGN
jgi:hypothetical protein